MREVAGATSEDSDYARAIAEILAAVGPEEEPVDAASEAVRASPARFPALSSAEARAGVPGPAPTVPRLPVLPPGSGLSLVQRQVEELLQVGRREGLDLKEADERMISALRDENFAELEELRRFLFVQVAGSVAEDLEIQSGRRNELAGLVATATIDTELAGARTDVAAGDLSGAVRRLRLAAEGLSTLEEEWATCQILTAGADLMIETLRELGQDPGPALGPLSEGKRLARAGESDQAEHMLAGANRALWGLLVPQLNASLQGIRTQLLTRRAEDQDIEPVVRELRQLAALIRRRNFGAAVTAYRRLRAAASAWSVTASA
ncbi:MAG TPA: hypothetical protein VKT21_04345 [Thermoplasmata archaeon]|nr:hypothetical protein [Thermoplasmata archaeon]